MRVDYDVTKKDFIDFNLFHMKKSSATRTIKIFTYGIPIILIGWILLSNSVSFDDLIIRIVIFICMAAALVVMLWLTSKLSSKLIVSRLFNEGKNKDVLGKHTIIIDDEGLIETTENSENRTKWAGIEKIVCSDTAILVYNSAISAYIIPKRAFENERCMNDFYEFIKERIKD